MVCQTSGLLKLYVRGMLLLSYAWDDVLESVCALLRCTGVSTWKMEFSHTIGVWWIEAVVVDFASRLGLSTRLGSYSFIPLFNLLIAAVVRKTGTNPRFDERAYSGDGADLEQEEGARLISSRCIDHCGSRNVDKNR